MAGIFNSSIFNNAIFNIGDVGAAAAVIAAAPSGVRRGKAARGGKRPELIVRLADVESRADTAEFLKDQLRLRHPESAFADDVPARPRETRAARVARERIKAAMEIEQAEEKRLQLVAANNAILTLLLMGSL